MQFQSTGPLRDPTRYGGRRSEADRISIHRSLAGPDLRWHLDLHLTTGFQSTGPLRDPTRRRTTPKRRMTFQSTGPLRDPTSQTCLHGRSVRNFNPQVPCGTRQTGDDAQAEEVKFQSTGPLRDPTPRCCIRIRSASTFQSTGPLRDPTDSGSKIYHRHAISIHRSLAGPDRAIEGNPVQLLLFQSTGLLRDPTDYPGGQERETDISIHRSRAGPDSTLGLDFFDRIISIHRSLAGPDPVLPRSRTGTDQFQSTGPLRDPTNRQTSKTTHPPISIHRSLAGPDAFPPLRFASLKKFQSTGPLRDPTPSFLGSSTAKVFQSTGPLRDPTAKTNKKMPFVSAIYTNVQRKFQNIILSPHIIVSFP